MKEFEIAIKIGKELTEAELKEAAAKALGVKPEKVGAAVIVRRSVDARQDILYRYRVQAYREGEAYEPYKLPETNHTSCLNIKMFTPPSRSSSSARARPACSPP